MGVSSNQSAQPASADALMSALALLADPKALQDRLAELRAAEAGAREAIDAVGPANEVLKLREEAQHTLTEAKEVRRQAHEEAKEIVGKARRQAEHIITDAQSNAEGQLASAAEVAADADRMRSEVAKQHNENVVRSDEMRKLMDDLEARIAEVKKERAELADLRSGVEAERERLYGVMESMKRSLQG